MLLGIIVIIFFFGSSVLLIWWSVEKEKKESRNPLSDDLKSHYFIKKILNITDKLKELEENDKIIEFLQKETDKLQSNYMPNMAGDPSRFIHISLIQNLGMVGSVLGEVLFKNQKEIENKIWKFREIQNIWVYYLCHKITKENMSRKEKKEIERNIEDKLTYLLNFEILFLTNQTNIKDAWMIILKDKILTNKVLNQLWGYVRKILFPEYK